MISNMPGLLQAGLGDSQPGAPAQPQSIMDFLQAINPPGPSGGPGMGPMNRPGPGRMMGGPGMGRGRMMGGPGAGAGGDDTTELMLLMMLQQLLGGGSGQ